MDRVSKRNFTLEAGLSQVLRESPVLQDLPVLWWELPAQFVATVDLSRDPPPHH